MKLYLNLFFSAIYSADADLDAILSNQKTSTKLKARKELKKLIISVVTNYFIYFDVTNSDLLDFIRDTTFDIISVWYEQRGRKRNTNYGKEDESIAFGQ